MNRIGRLSSAVVWLLAVLVAWLERQAETEREATADQTGGPNGDGAAPTRPTERPAPQSTAERPSAQPAATPANDVDESPATDEEPRAEAPARSPRPEQSASARAPRAQAGSAAASPAAADQATAGSEDGSTTTAEAVPPTAASPDVLAVAAGDLATGGAERRHGRSVPGDGTRDCPPDYPIKGNADSRIYHRPGDASYAATIAELCFASAEDAEAEGFRPRKR